MIPTPQQERIYQKYISGKSMRTLAKSEKRNRRTIAKIIAVHAEDQAAFVAHTRELVIGLAPVAISCLKAALEKGDALIAYRLLEAIGVIPSVVKGMAAPLVDPTATKEPLSERAKKVLLSQLSSRDRMAFEIASMVVDKSEAYGEELTIQQDIEQTRRKKLAKHQDG